MADIDISSLSVVSAQDALRRGDFTSVELTQAVLDAIGPDAPVYLTIDLDVLDPAEFPGTGTPEAGGFSFLRLLGDIRRICARLHVVALDNVELAPTLDPTGRSTALACKLLREELLAL